jgi:uridylate kinase
MIKSKKLKKDSPVVISVGGSLIVPEHIDTLFLSNFKTMIEKEIALGKRFIIICGGGKTARNYQKAGVAVTTLKPTDVDWIGIHSTRLNAQLIKTIFYPNVEERVVRDPNESFKFKKKILIAAGWKPGRSTDFCAVMLAKKFGAKKIINLSNIDYVFDKDPNKHYDAKPLLKVSWKDFRQLIPAKWDPGLSSPFDPVASRVAQKEKMEVAIINGENLKELDNFINDRHFEGTLIS